MSARKKPLTDFGLEVTMYCARHQVTCKEIATRADISRVALSEVMHGRRAGTRKIIPAVRKVMLTMRKAPNSIAK